MNDTGAELKHASVAERQLNYHNGEWRLHFKREPQGDLPPGMEKPPEANETVRPNDVVHTSRLGGLLRHYERRAA